MYAIYDYSNIVYFQFQFSPFTLNDNPEQIVITNVK